MDEYMLSLMNYVSLNDIVIAFIIFGLTMIIKRPIKKATQYLEEVKRKGINSVIVVIPIALSIVANMFFYGFFYKTWFSLEIINSIIHSWIISVSIYAIYSRIKIIYKALKENTLTSELLRENGEYMESELRELVIMIQGYQSLLDETKKKIVQLNNEKKDGDLTTIFNANIQLQSLTELEKSLTADIQLLQNKLNELQMEEIKNDISK